MKIMRGVSPVMGNCMKRSSRPANSTGPNSRGRLTRPRGRVSSVTATHYRNPILPVVYFTSPDVSHPVNQLSEEEQVRIAKRIGLINRLPTGTYEDDINKDRECDICMVEYALGDKLRFLPCMHTYHVHCIDEWLMRSFTCPSCMEPVDTAIFTNYENVVN